ncbi:MAG: response regulator [Planctomycetota bacterium]|nr:MAG: response regulator [Planctomycetota bacterium]
MNQEQAILLVEDSDDDAELTRLAFKQARIFNPLVRVRDGVEALDYLFCRGEHAARNIDERPAVVLLDLNLPRIGGLEVLTAIRADPRTCHLPVVVLTSSDEERDRIAAYSRFANSYVRKPVDYDQFFGAARELGLYWLVLNRPAPNGGSVSG